MESTIKPLTGKEIKDTMKIRLTEMIDKIPLLRASTTFKKAEISFGFSMSAYPSDIPVPPEIELDFSIDSKSLEQLDEKEKFLAHKSFVEKLLNARSQIEELLEIYRPEHFDEEFIETVIPDKIRLEAGLPITVLEMDSQSGVRREVEVSAETIRKNLSLSELARRGE